MNILPRYEEAVIPVKKFTEYALHAKNSKGKHIAFEEALGYNLENFVLLIKNIRCNIANFPCIERGDSGHGMHYYIDMELEGVNGKHARVRTAWVDCKKTGEMRLTSAFVKKRRKENENSAVSINKT
ncbi:MAG: hypothetical protein FWB74_04835 [Defluviitaleaceae bacterium]|nr:hypothetical protein [Defluviitaleaceae bacterium]